MASIRTDRGRLELRATTGAGRTRFARARRLPERMTLPGGTLWPGGMPMPQDPAIDVTEVPPDLASFLNSLDEFAQAPQPTPPREHPLHVPLFFHQMNGFRGTPVFQ